MCKNLVSNSAHTPFYTVQGPKRNFDILLILDIPVDKSDSVSSNNSKISKIELS